MKIDKSEIKAIFEFSPKDHWLFYDKDRSEWCLCYKIDRSFKGKDPDVGMPVVYMEEAEAEQLKKYFDIVEF